MSLVLPPDTYRKRALEALLTTFDRRARSLADIKVPTLLIAGSEFDKTAPAAVMMERMAARRSPDAGPIW